MTRLLSIKEVATLMGFKSPAPVSRLVKQGDIKSIRVGRGRKIPDWEYERYVKEMTNNEHERKS